MSDSQHRLVLAKYNGVVKPIACHLSGQASPLVALSNYLTLKLGGEAKETIPSHVQESHLIECIQSTLLNLMPHFAERRHVSEIPNKKEHFLQNVVPSLAKGVRLNASCRGTQDFKLCDELLVFYSVDAKLVHGWLSDPDDKEVFDVIGKCTHGSLLRRINEEGIKELVSGSKNPSSLGKRIQMFIDSGLTNYGFKILCKELNEHQLAILCIKDQFDVICKYSGDLFVLVTDEHILMRFGEALWKRLAMTEEETFYVSMEFVPIKGQQNYPKASEWFQRTLSEFDDPGDKGDKKKIEKNITKKVQEEAGKSAISGHEEAKEETKTPKLETSGDDASISDKPPPTLADRFLTFLLEFRAGGDAPFYEGVIEGMKAINLFTLYVPFSFIQQHNGQLAIDIQDQYRSVYNELLQHVISRLEKHGFDKKLATKHAQLEILGLPEPKSIQNFVRFVEDNEIVHPYKLDNNVWDNAITSAGRNMGLGYLNHLFDRFDIGVCWGRGEKEWGVNNLEVRSEGKEFVINQEPDQEATQELVVYNLLKLFDIIQPCYEGTIKKTPVFFDSLQHDILTAPDPKGDRQTWSRYSKFMRSALAFKPPVVRAGLITNVYKVLALPIIVKNVNFQPILKKLGDDWRSCARQLEPFILVYKYRNDISENFIYDKWEQNHWNVVKYSRHFIEHVVLYLKSNSLLHDIGIIEMMVARCLERYIARSMRAIVMEYGVNGMLSSAWGCFEDSDCKTMPLQTLPQDIVGTVSKQGENLEGSIYYDDELVIHISDLKSGDKNIVWGHSEIENSSLSDGLASEESIGLPAAPTIPSPSLARLKNFLVAKEWKIEKSIDGLRRGEYVLVSKVVRHDGRSNRNGPKIAIEGPVCIDYQAIVVHVTEWLSSPENQ